MLQQLKEKNQLLWTAFSLTFKKNLWWRRNISNFNLFELSMASKQLVMAVANVLHSDFDFLSWELRIRWHATKLITQKRREREWLRKRRAYKDPFITCHSVTALRESWVLSHNSLCISMPYDKTERYWCFKRYSFSFLQTVMVSCSTYQFSSGGFWITPISPLPTHALKLNISGVHLS